jgi:hypothetical protein
MFDRYLKAAKEIKAAGFTRDELMLIADMSDGCAFNTEVDSVAAQQLLLTLVDCRNDEEVDGYGEKWHVDWGVLIARCKGLSREAQTALLVWVKVIFWFKYSIKKEDINKATAFFNLSDHEQVAVIKNRVIATARENGVTDLKGSVSKQLKAASPSRDTEPSLMRDFYSDFLDSLTPEDTLDYWTGTGHGE